jgi:hypothetical protein
MEIGYIPLYKGSSWKNETEEISSMLKGLIKYLDNLP